MILNTHLKMNKLYLEIKIKLVHFCLSNISDRLSSSVVADSLLASRNRPGETPAATAVWS